MRKKKETPGLPSFSKNSNNNKKSQFSILHKHDQYLENFANKKERLKNIQIKMNTIKNEINKLNIEDENSVVVSNIKPNGKKVNSQKKNLLLSNKLNKIRENNERLKTLKEEYDFINLGNDEIEYLLESSKIISEYTTLEERESQLLSMSNLSDSGNLELNKLNEKKSELIENYLFKFEPEYIKRFNNVKEDLSCKICRIPYETLNSFYVCPQCGTCVYTVEQATELSYKEMQDFDYRPQFTYDKRSHLEDWLKRFQAKENRGIPQEILDKVILEAQKERVKDLQTLTEEKIKKYLKKLNLNDYYDNVIGIINRINNRPPFTLTIEIEDKIKLMFQQIQDPYENFKPSGRKNFLSYSYTLHKFFKILGLHEFAKYFPLLKSTDKLRQQDDIFKKIVGHMSQIDKTTKWVFYPSV